MVEIDFLVDTDVLIEIFRASRLAKGWLESVQEDIIGIPVLVYLEILQPDLFINLYGICQTPIGWRLKANVPQNFDCQKSYRMEACKINNFN